MEGATAYKTFYSTETQLYVLTPHLDGMEFDDTGLMVHNKRELEELVKALEDDE